MFSDITFSKLHTRDFPQLYEWLCIPHVKVWWDSDVSWSLDLVESRYKSYTDTVF